MNPRIVFSSERNRVGSSFRAKNSSRPGCECLHHLLRDSSHCGSAHTSHLLEGKKENDFRTLLTHNYKHITQQPSNRQIFQANYRSVPQYKYKLIVLPTERIDGGNNYKHDISVSVSILLIIA